MYFIATTTEEKDATVGRSHQHVCSQAGVQSSWIKAHSWNLEMELFLPHFSCICLFACLGVSFIHGVNTNVQGT